MWSFSSPNSNIILLLQKILSKVHYKYTKSSHVPVDAGIPVSVKEADQLTFELIKKIYDLCSEINNDDSKLVGKAPVNYQLEVKQLGFIPSAAVLDRILSIELLQTLHEFSQMYGCVPTHYNFNDYVWPIPQDLIPNNLFDWNKYDINLTFGDRNKDD